MTSKPESPSQLFESVKATFPASLGPEKWFLVVATSALVTCSGPFQLGQLYLCLKKQPEYASLPHRRDLDKRLREFLIKQGLKTGASKAATALPGLTKEEQPDNGKIARLLSQLDDANHEKESAILEKIFGPKDNANLFTKSDAFFKSMAKQVVDGMTCADDWELDAVERQLITYIGLTCQGITMQSIDSMQCALDGLQDFVLSANDIKQMTECGELVSRWADYDMRYWPELKILKPKRGREVGLLYSPPRHGREV